MEALELLNRGYTDLISVTPPKCLVAENSHIRHEDCGKVPGLYGPEGWYGYDWRKAANPTHADVTRWAKHKANVGLRAGAFPAIDIDCTNQALSNVIRGLALTHLGMAPERVGSAPKRLLMYKTSEPFRRMRLWIRLGNEKHLIEVLGDGQQYVVAGVHPKTMKPYTYPCGMMDADDLQEITRDEVDAWLNLVAETLDAFGYACEREGSGALSRERSEVDQSRLVGDSRQIALALSYLPNTNELFPGRDDYLRVGYAVKAALGEEGYPLFEEWALGWEGNDAFAGNDVDTVRADWERMQPPFEVGAPWLYELAQKHGYDWAADEFEADEALVGEAPAGESGVLSDAEFAAAVAAQVIPGDDNPNKPSSARTYARYSDADMAERLAKRRGGTIRYSEDGEKWAAWSGQRWSNSGDNLVKHAVSKLCQEALPDVFNTAATPKDAESRAMSLCSANKMNAIVSYAQTLPELQIKMEQFDADPHLLNTPKGVVNLRTGEWLAHNPEFYMTKITSVAPEYGVPQRWMQFLHEATGGDQDMIEYLQRVAGYALTGEKTLHTLHFFYGPGGNGKGTFLNTLRDVWGDYAATADMSLFVSQRYEQHSTGLADLAGARLVLAQETDENRTWDEAKLKQLTSNDRVKARFMRRDFFEFRPMFKLLFAGNHRPGIKNVDDALRRRIHIVPFTIKPATPDPLLGKKLEDEYPQILQWAIEGARKFYADGELRDPAIVHEATEEYFDEEDDFSQWLRERTSTDNPDAFTPTATLVEDYMEWAARNQLPKRSGRAISILIRDKGFRKFRAAADQPRGFVGIRLTRRPGDEFDCDPDLA